jgi:hypothetical protein
MVSTDYDGYLRAWYLPIVLALPRYNVTRTVGGIGRYLRVGRLSVTPITPIFSFHSQNIWDLLVFWGPFQTTCSRTL